MKFNLGTTGADSINQGIGSVFKALAMGPYLQQQAAQQAALRDAQAYEANMTGNEHGAKAAGLQYTLDQRKAVPELVAADPAMPAYMKSAYKLFGLTGDNNVERIAKAGSELQGQGYRDDAASAPDVPSMNRLLAIAAGKPYLPMKAVGDTGYSIDRATGAQTEQNPVLAKLFAGGQNAVANQHNAAAALSGERQKEIQIGKVQPGTDENGNPILFRSGTNGDISILDNVGPYHKAGGADAALQKARAEVARDVFKDLSVAPEDRAAEIDRRMALITGAKSPAAPKPAPTMDAGLPKGLPAGSKQIGTSGGKPVFQAPNGKKYIVE